jgi:quinol monooxygenase YgiN
MIRVIATINLKPGRREAFLAALRANVPNVLAESGCREYAPMADLASGLPPQIPLRPDTITIVEAWDSLDHLRVHLSGLPHMLRYKEATRDMVAGVSLQVLQPVVQSVTL